MEIKIMYSYFCEFICLCLIFKYEVLEIFLISTDRKSERDYWVQETNNNNMQKLGWYQ
jgi:hypothetical protein